MNRDHLFGDLTGRLPIRPGTTLVAVDGIDGSGKTTFADAWAAHIGRERPAYRVHADRYLNPAAVRYRQGRHSPVGFVEDTYDLDALRHEVIEPSRQPRASFRPGIYDVQTESADITDPVLIPPGAVLIIDGMFLHRDELSRDWDFSLWLHTTFAVTYARMAVRNGCPADPEDPANRRYVEGQRRYIAATRPWERADVVIDNTDPADPVLRSRH